MSQQRRGIAYRLWEMVEHARAERGWTQEDLQRVTGVARNTIINWRTARRPPNPATVVRVATALGIDPDTALRASRGEPDPEPSPYTDPHERAIWELKGLTEAQRHALIASLRALLAADEGKHRRTGTG